MNKFTLKDLARTILQEVKKPLTAQEIWHIAQEKGLDKKYNFIGKDPWNTISVKIKNEILENDHSPFILIQSRPFKFYLKTLGSEQEIGNLIQKEKEVIEEAPSVGYSEEDLYPLLAYFCDNNNIHPKTIRHQKSSKKSYSQWLHPDMVGAYFPIKRWSREVVELSKTLGALGVKLFSFEVKKSLGFANLRDSYFQAVSNSSWANEGYLVTAEIYQDEDLLSELKRLTNAFGIGFIKLDINNPDESSIIIPAKNKEVLDWDTINKLVEGNPDFMDFITSVKDDSAINKIHKENYDKILEAEILRDKFININKP